MNENVPLDGAAVLVWLPPGVTPDDNDFDPSNIKPPPPGNPEPWWFAHEAIHHAGTTIDTYGKVPWIKIGDLLLGPEEIKEISAKIGQWSKYADRT